MYHFFPFMNLDTLKIHLLLGLHGVRQRVIPAPGLILKGIKKQLKFVFSRQQLRYRLYGLCARRRRLK